MHVLVNAANLTAAGPRTLALQLLPALGAQAPDVRFTALVPDSTDYRGLSVPENMRRVYWQRARRWPDLARMWQLYLTVPRFVRRLRPDVCFTLGDLGAFNLACPQVILLHLALLVYDRGELGGLDSWSSFKRHYMEWHFAHAARRASRIIVQTPAMASRLTRKHGIARARIEIIAQPAAHASQPGQACPALELVDKRTKLLFLAACYPHKNHVMLPALAAELRARGLATRVHIFTTLPAEDFARIVGAARVDDVITNLGPLQPNEVGGALKSASALFLPTLVESYGLTYLESLEAGRPILTSDRDFARHMCGELALYFEPEAVDSIADAIQRFDAGDGRSVRSLRANGRFAQLAAARLRLFPSSWDAVARDFLRVLAAAAPQAAAQQFASSGSFSVGSTLG